MITEFRSLLRCLDIVPYGQGCQGGWGTWGLLPWLPGWLPEVVSGVGFEFYFQKCFYPSSHPYLFHLGFAVVTLYKMGFSNIESEVTEKGI